MSEDRSLDDFLGDSGDGDGEGGEGETDERAAETERDAGSDEADEEVTDEVGDGAKADAAAVEPAAPTYRWDRGGAACDGCGEAVERRWADGDAFVCADCKEW